MSKAHLDYYARVVCVPYPVEQSADLRYEPAAEAVKNLKLYRAAARIEAQYASGSHVEDGVRKGWLQGPCGCGWMVTRHRMR